LWFEMQRIEKTLLRNRWFDISRQIIVCLSVFHSIWTFPFSDWSVSPVLESEWGNQKAKPVADLTIFCEKARFRRL
jgi:hypothetical protein